MPETQPKTSVIEKICQDSECSDKMAALSGDQIALFKKFTFCPFCAEELNLVCQNCREQLNSTDYKFCPWCGAKFVEPDEEK
jgi:predicted RNA-binding Zn-ribbon protein involved in translation (DUF1610 family)